MVKRRLALSWLSFFQLIGNWIGRQGEAQCVLLSTADLPLLLETITELLAESAEKRLKRLVGLHSDARHVPPAHPV